MMELEHRKFLEQFVSDYSNCSTLGDIIEAFNRDGTKQFDGLLARTEFLLKKIVDLEALLVWLAELKPERARLIKFTPFQDLVAKRAVELAENVHTFNAVWVTLFENKFSIIGPPKWLLTALDHRAAVLLKEEKLVDIYNLSILFRYLFFSDLYPESRRVVLDRIKEVLPSEKDMLMVASQYNFRPLPPDEYTEEFKTILFHRLKEMLDYSIAWDNSGVMIEVINKMGEQFDPDLERLFKVKAMEFLEK